MDDRGVHRVPYRGVAALAHWAEENYAVLDARCAIAGQDPLELPPDRFFNLAYTVVMEAFVLDGKKAAEVRDMLTWSKDDDRDVERDRVRSDQMVRSSAAVMGINPDAAFAAMMDARRRAGLLDEPKGGEDAAH